jgi:hypothetical protein
MYFFLPQHPQALSVSAGHARRNRFTFRITPSLPAARAFANAGKPAVRFAFNKFRRFATTLKITP